MTFVTLYGVAPQLKIFRLQKCACEVILDYNVDDSIEAMNSLKIMSIYDRLYLRKGALAIRLIFSLVDMITKPKFSNCPNVFKSGLFR